MTEYNKYVLAVNKIFEVLGKLKANYNDKDSNTYISELENYKEVIIKAASRFSNVKDESNIITEQKNMKEIDSIEENI